jgi:nicotinamidase-related amidase
MENGPKALILVDYTVDFVAADGKLTVGEPGQQIEAAIAEKIKVYAEAGHLILAVNDLHDAHDTHHPEHELFPPHNLAGTEGRNLYGGIEGLLKCVELEYPGQVFRLDKRRYSAFCGTPLELILRQERIQDLELAGVCTDICVMHTAIEAYNKGFRVLIDEEAVASFNETAHRTALDHFESVLGFQVKRRG